MGIIENGTMQELWGEIEEKLKANSQPYAEMRGLYEIQIIDEELTYQLAFKDGGLSITNQSNQQADCILKMKSATFRKFLSGNLNSMSAFMTGKLKVDGNIGLALKLESVLKKYQF
ncbi:SCP2 sterol-binding domain-containing protein [Ornithinibacillus scapharcae]|uniref:SCP2 sterol-binding domain-containing protein n=1 Tax=Ornithinibacillus scapharcae TaxID=1147159 RepID=UPI000225AD91|nr:SCP2 sterol-binding domain-containing protein [Ornithinibacillus scapharcae]